MAKFKKTLAAFAMPVVALIAAAVTCFFVPFDKQYLDYFDFRTLACLFCTLAVVCAFKNIRFFRWLADVIVRRFKTVRRAVIALVFVTSPFCRWAFSCWNPARRENILLLFLSCKTSPQTSAECSLPSAILRICTCIPSIPIRRESFSALWLCPLPLPLYSFWRPVCLSSR